MMSKLSGNARWLGAAIVLIAVIAVAISCGSEAEPTAAPEPTATPTPPTATPVPPTATTSPPTEAPEPTAEPQAMATLEDLVLTPATTGQDLIDRISEEEANCIKNVIGEAFFGLMMQAPLMQAGADPAAAAPVFGCLTVDNILLFGIAMFDAQAGGWAPETRACVIGVGREHPDLVLSGLGMEVASTATDDHPYLVELYECMNAEERVGYLYSLQSAVDAATSAERDLINVIPEAEAACIRENTSDEEYNMVLGTTVHMAFANSDAVASCVTPEEGYVSIFIAITEATIGGLSDESRSCLADFGMEHPHYVALVNPAAFDPSVMTHEVALEIAEDGVRMYSCMNEDELRRMQSFSSGAGAQ